MKGRRYHPSQVTIHACSQESISMLGPAKPRRLDEPIAVSPEALALRVSLPG
ncbi:MAG: hypothetical protein K0R44_3635 [Thermomicrobiales bacterium]|jgi:hypothetical protein|nr:hypothetical protein [Thermomicrobiales bacterium]